MEHFFGIHVGVVDTLKLDDALHVGEFHRIGIFHLRRLVHQFAETLETGCTVLERLHKEDEGVDRAGEQTHRHDKGGIITEIKGGIVEEEQTACDEDDDVEHVGDEGGGGVEARHRLIGTAGGIHKGVVALFEFRLFGVGVGISLGDTNTRDAALHRGVDDGVRLAAVGEGLLHTAAQEEGGDHQNRHASKDNQRQLPLDGAEINEGEHHHHRAGEQTLRAVMGQFADFKQIAGDAGHNATCLVVVKIGEGQFLQMSEEVAAHLRLHPHTDHMAVILHEIIERPAQDVQSQHHQTRDDDGADVGVGDVVVEHGAGDVGIHHTQQGDGHRGNHIRRKQFLVRFIVTNESLKHILSLLFYTIARAENAAMSSSRASLGLSTGHSTKLTV